MLSQEADAASRLLYKLFGLHYVNYTSEFVCLTNIWWSIGCVFSYCVNGRIDICNISLLLYLIWLNAAAFCKSEEIDTCILLIFHMKGSKVHQRTRDGPG